MPPTANNASQHFGITQDAQAQLQRANAELAVLRVQIKQLESSEDVPATIQQQAAETQERARKADDRAREAESQRSDVIKAQAHLSSALDDAKAAHTTSKARIEKLEADLATSNADAELLRKQLKTSQDEVGELKRKEQQWAVDRVGLERNFDEALGLAKKRRKLLEDRDKEIDEFKKREAELWADAEQYVIYGDDPIVADMDLSQ